MLRVGLEVRTTAQESENSEAARPERCIKKLFPVTLPPIHGRWFRGSEDGCPLFMTDSRRGGDQVPGL